MPTARTALEGKAMKTIAEIYFLYPDNPSIPLVQVRYYNVMKFVRYKNGLIQHECPVVLVQTKTDFYYTPPLDLSYSSSLTLGQKDDGLVVQ